jgi:hypothetical protein
MGAAVSSGNAASSASACATVSTSITQRSNRRMPISESSRARALQSKRAQVHAPPANVNCGFFSQRITGMRTSRG